MALGAVALGEGAEVACGAAARLDGAAGAEDRMAGVSGGMGVLGAAGPCVPCTNCLMRSTIDESRLARVLFLTSSPHS
jgi:hypothetical protein